MAAKLKAFVIVDSAKCIGCKACELACAVVRAGPNTKVAGAMDIPVIPHLFIKTAGITAEAKAGLIEKNFMVASKCDLCIECSADRPACINACPKQAIEIVCLKRHNICSAPDPCLIRQKNLLAKY
ncbi:4Fe-4S dicluster domain-containing protein [Sporomusa termitida]|uniref:4Fe-4S ferredoxin-type domain-containing protein n=1 Tax=Sporomusa termitida TaxID=2377 RepID=A0A517DYU4_9FIRM|nr:4Fe-4S dicluster domain-containing protein [Sporomusa termitida]QDR82524.1 hypothetical protein SPTER_39520 [Sporomusa termitida]